LKVITFGPQETWLVLAGGLVCPLDNLYQKKVLLLIQDGIIKKILPFLTKQQLGSYSIKYHFLDLSGFTVLPGMVDCHVHMALDGKGLQEEKYCCLFEPEKITAQVERQLHAYLSSGVLAVRDGGDCAGAGLFFREKVKSGVLQGPHIISTGNALRKPGMYGSFLGPGIKKNDLNEAIDNLIAAGVNQIKALVSGIVSFKEYGKVGPLQFNCDELNFIVAKSRRAGLKVMAHANSEEAVTMAAKAGVDSIEHGYFMGKEALKTLAGLGIAWIPTVIPVAVQAYRADLFNRTERKVIEKTCRRQLETIGEAAEMGVLLGIGTDAGSPGVRHGYSLFQELELYRTAGLSPAAILKAATVNGAKILGMEQMTGSIKEGYSARLIAVPGNPLEDFSILKNISYVLMPAILK
jgi:imidazolonepropionase-like amidohydrolase